MNNSGNKGNKKALVIAVSEYESSNLKSIQFCRNDGQEMFEVLKKLGYDIPDKRRLIGNVDSQILKNTIYDFFTNEENKPDDTLVFYYSGHGVPDKWGTNYLAPSNINSDRPFLTGFSFDNLTNAMLESNSLSVVTILDSCYSGSLKIGKGLDSKGGEDGMTTIANKIVEEKSDKLHQGIGRCLLASSQGYEEAYDKEEKDHSIFTYYLLEGLNGNKEAVDDDGNVTYDTLGKFISREFGKLPTSKRPKQTPVRKGELAGTDIVLAEYPKLRRPKEDYYSLFGRGEKYLRSNKLNEALECFNAILETRPDDQDALLRKGYLLLRTKEDKKAMVCFDYLIELNKNNSQAWYYKAQLHLQLKNYEAASKCLQQATDISPNDDSLWEIYKRVKSLLWSSRQKEEQDFVPQPEYLEASRQKEEQDFVQQLSEHDDLHDIEKENIIKEYDPINLEYIRKQKAENIIQNQVKENTSQIGSPKNSGSTNIDQDEQLNRPSKTSTADVNNVKELNRKALAFYKEGKYEEAISLYDKALDIEPSNLHSLNNKALALHELRKYEEAIVWYDRALAIDPNFEIAQENKKLALEDMSKEKGDRTYEVFHDVKIKPKNLAEELVSYLKQRDFKVVSRFDDQYNTYYVQASKTDKLSRIVGISKSVRITIRGKALDLEISLSTGEFKKNLLSQLAISAPLSALTLGIPIPTVAAVGTAYLTKKKFNVELWNLIESKIFSSKSHIGAVNSG
jgi:tetratricopeptide (TPR) repeat protein